MRYVCYDCGDIFIGHNTSENPCPKCKSWRTTPLEKIKVLKIESNNSKWEFWNLFNKTVNQLHDYAKEMHTYSEPKFGFERTLIRFLERLPSGDYSKLREDWNKIRRVDVKNVQ